MQCTGALAVRKKRIQRLTNQSRLEPAHVKQPCLEVGEARRYIVARQILVLFMKYKEPPQLNIHRRH